MSAPYGFRSVLPTDDAARDDLAGGDDADVDSGFAQGVEHGPRDAGLRAHSGTDGTDRITIIWADHAIRNQWLRVTVPAGTPLGLPADDVFYFGNAVGEAGNSTTDAQVTGADLSTARNNPRSFLNPAEIDCPYDYNRDQRVAATDVLLARNNQTNFLTALKLIDLSGSEGEDEGEELLASSSPQQNTVLPAADSNALFDDMDWLSELYQIRRENQSCEKHDPAKEAVDRLLETYWLSPHPRRATG